MELKSFRIAKENALNQRKLHLENVEAERAPRINKEPLVPRDISELMVFPPVV